MIEAPLKERNSFETHYIEKLDSQAPQLRSDEVGDAPHRTDRVAVLCERPRRTRRAIRYGQVERALVRTALPEALRSAASEGN